MAAKKKPVQVTGEEPLTFALSLSLRMFRSTLGDAAHGAENKTMKRRIGPAEQRSEVEHECLSESEQTEKLTEL